MSEDLEQQRAIEKVVEAWIAYAMAEGWDCPQWDELWESMRNLADTVGVDLYKRITES